MVFLNVWVCNMGELYFVSNCFFFKLVYIDYVVLDFVVWFDLESFCLERWFE